MTNINKWTVIRMNWNELMIERKKIYSKEERENLLNYYEKVIKKERHEERRKRMDNFSVNNIQTHYKNLMILISYAVYLFIGLAIILWQLQLTASFSHQSVSDYISQKKANWNIRWEMADDEVVPRNLNIDDPDTIKYQYEGQIFIPFDLEHTFTEILMANWEQDVLIPLIYGFNKTLLRNNYIFGNFPARI